MAKHKPTVRTETITIEGQALTLVLQRKAVKNINARLHDTTLTVSVPLRLPESAVDEAVAHLARRLLRRVHARRVNSAEDAVALAQRIARRFPTPVAVERVLFVTTQRARWGSYSSRTHTIRLHAALQRMPRWVLEAVVAHELAHVFHLDHSPAFWSLLRQVCPDTDRARAFLEGVSWLARGWSQLPETERALLTGGEYCSDADERQVDSEPRAV